MTAAGQQRWLEAEIAAWEAEGLISGEQARALLARYRARRDAGQHGRLVGTLAVLGAVLVGVGVILFFAANWERIPKFVRVAAILAAMTASYAGGFELSAGRRYPRAGRALILLGALLFGAGIWLIAQIFHLEAHYPNGLLYWAGGALLTALAARSTPAAILGAVLLGAWTLFEQADFGRPNLAYPALAALVALPIAHRQRSPVAAAFSLAGMPIWAAANLLRWSPGDEETGMLLAGVTALCFGCAYLALALWRGAATASALTGPRGAVPWPLAGATFALAGAYLLTFGWRETRWMGNVTADLWPWLRASAPALLLLGTVAAIAVTGLAVAHVRFWRARSAGEAHDATAPWLAGAVALLLLSAAALLFPGADAYRPIAFNLILFLAVIGTVAAGYRSRAAGWINLGLLVFAVDVVTRYFDLFWSLLDRSAFFIGAGLLLLVAGGLLERGRRRLLAGLNDPGVET